MGWEPERAHLVSIPFIAGQWSLRRMASMARDGGAGVSIPFIAGQWSLLMMIIEAVTPLAESQSPSLRGSGRFALPPSGEGGAPSRLNPLHCGAVVASWRRGKEEVMEMIKSQSPSLRGSGRFRVSPMSKTNNKKVSIPFIAGQWSLHLERRQKVLPFPFRLNPLHCGAVVASPDWIGRGRPRPRVSIPFIAGQWSLRGGGAARRRADGAGFNPLHCGAVVASRGRPGRRAAAPGGVSIPFIAGQWSLQKVVPAASGSVTLVSIPFIAGQWSLHKSMMAIMNHITRFQSPSLRGSGRFVDSPPYPTQHAGGFNPLHCGAVVASYTARAPAALTDVRFQSPSLRGSGRFRASSTSDKN